MNTVCQPQPQPFSADGMPTRVRVYEVGPRDGLQAEPNLVPLEVKAEFCRRLVEAGVTTIELTSFVSPNWIPQLADAEELMAELSLPASVRQVVLVPNQHGLNRALASGAREIAVFVSATETFAAKNLNSTIRGALDAVAPVVRDCVDARLPVRGYISMCFGDPWEGAVAPATVADVAEQLVGLGVTSLSLGDTIGVATPRHVQTVIGEVLARGIGVESIAMHFHDTYGQALTNVYASLQAGITEFDSAAGGLGRCPYAKGATGNLASEDLLWMLHGLGISTGINLDALALTSSWMAEQMGQPSPSAVVTALAAARAPNTL